MSRTPFYIQIHTLTSYPGTLLNRDDAGFAKRLPFGGVTRTRISSQCLKRHWRTFDGEDAFSTLDVPRSIRSRHTFDKRVAEPIKQSHEDYPSLLVDHVVSTIMDHVLGTKSKGELKTGQLTVLGESELGYLREVSTQLAEEILASEELEAGALTGEEMDKKALKVIDAHLGKALKDKDLKKNLAGLKMAAGLDAAMFGRMVTSDVLSRGDAAIHVAHAITVHAEESESDYFSAVDDLLAEEGTGELGSAHINSSELTSGLFYTYVVVDVPLLLANLTGTPQETWQEADRTLAAELVERLIKLIATVSPGAKLGSTAPYASAHFVLTEVGSAQPRTLANAFLKPVSKHGDVEQNTYDQLGQYINEYNDMYGNKTEQKCAGIRLSPSLLEALGTSNKLNLEAVATWTSDAVRQAGEAQ